MGVGMGGKGEGREGCLFELWSQLLGVGEGPLETVPRDLLGGLNLGEVLLLAAFFPSCSFLSLRFPSYPDLSLSCSHR